MSTDLRNQTLSGIGWSGAGQVLRQGTQFVVSAILARLLGPRDFGLIGMIVVFTGFAQLFSDLGLGAAVVQKAELADSELNSVFWVNVACGALLTAAAIAGAPLIASFYHEPLLQPLTAVAAFGFLVGSIRVSQQALLQKQMRFGQLFWVDAVSMSVSGLIAIAAALAGLGVWSLVLQSLLLTLVSTLMVWRFSPWRPTWRFEAGGLKGLLGFGLNLLGFNVTNYWMRNLDNLLVGRYVGPEALGIYSRAYSLMLLPINQVSSVISQVMFPVLATIQDDIERIKRIYLQSTRVIALVTFPIMIGLLVVAEPFVLTVFGHQWREMIAVTQILCLAGLLQSVGTTVGWIYTTRGRTDVMFKWGLFSGAIRVASFIVGLHWGIIGVSVAYVVGGYAILWYPSWAIPGRLINMRVNEMVRNLAAPFCCAAVMGTIVWLSGLILPWRKVEWALLMTELTIGVLVYGVLVHAFRLRAYLDVREAVWTRFRLILHERSAAARRTP